MLYNAFISYSHAADGKLAPALQKSLHRFARPLFRLRAVRLFRDKTNLAVTPDLWHSIVDALDASEYFILLASPDSAQSYWVQQEVRHWLETKSPQTMLIVVTDGEVSWDEKAGDFDWTRTTALPPALKGRFELEPLYVDLSWAKTQEHLSLRYPDFRTSIAQLAATLHGRPLDEISGEDVRQHRIFVRSVATGIAALVMATVAAIVMAYLAETNRKQAVRQGFISTSQALAAYAEREQQRSHRDERAALLARQAYLFNQRVKGDRLAQIGKALRSVLSKPYFSVEVTPRKNNIPLHTLAVSRDGRYLAAGGEGGHVYLWDLSTRPLQLSRLRSGENIIWTLGFASDSSTLFGGTHDGRVLYWPISKSGPSTDPAAIETRLDQRVDSLAVSGDNQWLALGGQDGAVYLWSLVQPDRPPVRLCCHDGAVTAVAFHPTKKTRLASGSTDKTAYLWDVSAPRAPIARYGEHDHRIRSIAFSHDGTLLAVGTEFSFVAGSLKESLRQPSEDFDLYEAIGGTIWLWDIAQPARPVSILKSGDTISISTLAFSADDSRLAANGGNNDLVVWEPREPGREPVRLRGHGAQVRAVAYSTLDSVFASLDDAGAIRLWDPRPPAAAPRILPEHEAAVTGVAFGQDSGELAAVSGSGIYLWDILAQHARKLVVEDSGSFLTLAFHPQRPWLAVGSGSSLLDIDNSVRIWQLTDTAKPFKQLLGATSDVTSIAISADGLWLAASGKLDQRVLIWNLDDLDRPPRTISLEDDVSALVYADNGDLLVAASDRVYRLTFDGTAWAISRIIDRQGSRIMTISFDPHNQRLATGAEDGTYRLWALGGPSDAARLERSLQYQTIYSVAFSPDGKEVAAGGKDGKVRLWDLERASADAQVFDGPGRRVYSVAFSADGDWLTAGGSDRSVMVWPRTKWLAEFACTKVTRNLTRDEWAEYVGEGIAYEKTCEDLPPASPDYTH